MSAPPSRSPLGRVAAALALALVLLAAPGPAAAHGVDDAPLREEDVVRRWVAGATAAELIATIRGAAVAFDLGDEMISELRATGLPAEVIEAMRARQRELAPADPQPPAEVPAAGQRVVVALAPAGPAGKRARPAALRVREELPAGLLAAWSLGPATESPRVDDVAIFLACRTAVHVPDHWRGRSPLGRDFVSMPRHHMLAFLAGARRTEDGLLELPIPETIDALLESAPDAAHDLSLGVALRVGERFYRLVDDAWDDLAGGDADLALAASITQRDPDPLSIEVRFDRRRTSR